jgi:hypothetical protein
MNISLPEIFYLLLFVGGPLLLPLISKKWKWFYTVLIGELLYILWGVMLHFSSADITEYGTAYGIFIVPYLILITIIGTTIEKSSGKNSVNN